MPPSPRAQDRGCAVMLGRSRAHLVALGWGECLLSAKRSPLLTWAQHAEDAEWGQVCLHSGLSQRHPAVEGWGTPVLFSMSLLLAAADRHSGAHRGSRGGHDQATQGTMSWKVPWPRALQKVPQPAREGEQSVPPTLPCTHPPLHPVQVQVTVVWLSPHTALRVPNPTPSDFLVEFGLSLFSRGPHQRGEGLQGHSGC